MVFVKHNFLKSDILFNPIFIPGFSGSRFFRVQVFQSPGFSGSRFFRIQVFQGSGPVSWSRIQSPGFRVQGPGPRSRVQVQVLEVAPQSKFSIYLCIYIAHCMQTIQRRIQNPVKHLTTLSVNYFHKKLHLRRLTGF